MIHPAPPTARPNEEGRLLEEFEHYIKHVWYDQSVDHARQVDRIGS